MYFLVERNDMVGHNFVGETGAKECLPAHLPSRHKVFEIDPRGQFHQHSRRSFCAKSLAPVKYKHKM